MKSKKKERHVQKQNSQNENKKNRYKRKIVSKRRKEISTERDRNKTSKDQFPIEMRKESSARIGSSIIN